MLPVWPLLVYFFISGLGADFQALISPSGVTGIYQADLCMLVSPPCMNEADRYSLEALRSIHQMMDDDKDGGIEVEESVEFIIEDMKQQQTNKHSNLHREDQHITVEELWRGWKSSEVHNWTQDVVLRWLREFVELPQYEKNFKEFKVNGNTLPRIAANEPSFLSFHLRIQDQRDKQKLNIKALDAVLFGPPTRPPHNYMKDLLLIVSVVMGIGGCWFAQAQNKASKVHIAKMMKDLESLQRAEQSLIDLQEQLEQAQEEKRNAAEEKQNLEEKIRDEIIVAQEEANRLHELRQGAVSELSRLRYAEEELEQVLGALKQAEQDMHASWTASEALQQWLQLTHEVEVQYYNVKKQSAVLQLACAKEEAERIKKKRSSVLGTLHVAHSSSLDQVDHKILEAKNALSEITACLRERLHRWQQIEQLCGFPIIRNLGLTHLTAQLYSDSGTLGLPRVPQSSCACHSSIHGSIEDLLEASASTILPQMPIPPLKRSPRTRQSTVCRSRHPGVISQPAAPLTSSHPDLLTPICSPYPFNEEEGRLLKCLKKQDSEERFSDPEYLTSAPISKRFPCPSVEISSKELHCDEAESLKKGKSKEAEAVVESPIRRISVHKLNASADLSCRKTVKDKLLDTSFEATLKKSKEESYMEATPRKVLRDKNEAHINVAFRNTFSRESDTDLQVRKLERDIIGDLTDTESRKVYRERSDFPLDVRKVLRNEKETATDVVTMKISPDLMGISPDSGTKKVLRDDTEHPFESVSRRIYRDSVGVSFNTNCKKNPRNKGECHLESTVRALAKDKMAEIVKAPPKTTKREELDYYAATASTRVLSRVKFEELLDRTPDKEKKELCLESPISKRLLGEELEISAGSLRRKVPRIPRDHNDSSTDSATGKQAQDRVDVQLDLPKPLVPLPNSGASESRSAQTAQPDLMITSQGPWKSSSDLLPSGPLSLVYDGILEKSYSMTSSDPPASTATLPQIRPGTDAETQLSMPAVTMCAELQGQKDKEKSRKSMRLKNLFKKKNESTTENVQSGV